MSQENVEAFKEGIEAGNRGDWDALLEGLDPKVEWHPALLTPLAGGTAVYRGHESVREWFQDVAEVLSDLHIEISEIRDLGDRIVAFGQIRSRGGSSGAETESPIAYVAEYENAKATKVQSYLDHQAALEAAGLSE